MHLHAVNAGVRPCENRSLCLQRRANMQKFVDCGPIFKPNDQHLGSQLTFNTMLGILVVDVRTSGWARWQSCPPLLLARHCKIYMQHPMCRTSVTSLTL
eukprot:5043279-Amphidinium_carterae.1